MTALALQTDPAESVPHPDLERAVAAVYSEIVRRGAHTTHHARWSLKQHLFETFNITRAWRQSPHVSLAALLHSAYSTDIFAEQLFGFDEREVIARLIAAGRGGNGAVGMDDSGRFEGG